MILCTLDWPQAVFSGPKKTKNQLRFARSSSLLASSLIFHQIVCQRHRFQCPHVVPGRIQLGVTSHEGKLFEAWELALILVPLFGRVWGALRFLLIGVEFRRNFFRCSYFIVVAAFYIWSRVLDMISLNFKSSFECKSSPTQKCNECTSSKSLVFVVSKVNYFENRLFSPCRDIRNERPPGWHFSVVKFPGAYIRNGLSCHRLSLKLVILYKSMSYFKNRSLGTDANGFSRHLDSRRAKVPKTRKSI
jgi:hypothetical protein